MSKVILLDHGVFCHRAIFGFGATKLAKIKGEMHHSAFAAPIGYLYFSMIISALKKIGVNKDDIIIMAMEGRDSWRKSYYADYKAQRAGLREGYKHIDWDECYGEITKIVDLLKESAPFYFIGADHIECDDVIAVACKFFKDQECVIVSIDADLQQLCYYPNVKYYSLLAKYKAQKGSYKIVENPLKIISDKVKKGDVSDNILVDKENDDDNDVALRKLIIDLLELPEFVIKAVQPQLECLQPKEPIYEKLPYPSSLAEKFKQIYDPQYKISYDDVIGYQEKKEVRKKNKKVKMKKEAAKNKVSLR